MFITRFMSLVAQWPGHSLVKPRLSYEARATRRTVSCLTTHLLLAITASLLLSACSGIFGNSASTPTSTFTTQGNVPLAQLHCPINIKPVIIFRDEGAAPTATATTTTTTTSTPGTTTTPTPRGSPAATATATTTVGAVPGTPTTLTDWGKVQANLGFTVYLPSALPPDTCLVSAQAVIHDPTLGGNFLIGYQFPDHTAITFSEVPLASQNTSLQCYASDNPGKATTSKNAVPPAGATQKTPSPSQVPLEVCSGAKTNTYVVLSARKSIEYLQQVFTSLQPNIAWMPTT